MRWWQMGQDPTKGFFPPAETTAQRMAETVRLNEVVFDTTLGEFFVGDGVTLGGKPLGAWPGVLSPGLQFEVQGTLLSSAPTTPIVLIPDALVPAGKSIYVNYLLVTVNGATAWTTAYNVLIEDDAGTPIVGVTLATANLLANAVLQFGSTGVTPGAAVLGQTGLTAGKGLVVVGSSASIIAGSPLIVTVGGYIK